MCLGFREWKREREGLPNAGLQRVIEGLREKAVALMSLRPHGRAIAETTSRQGRRSQLVLSAVASRRPMYVDRTS